MKDHIKSNADIYWLITAIAVGCGVIDATLGGLGL